LSALITDTAAHAQKPRWPFLNLFLINPVLFELACIRWFRAAVVFLTFFTNIVLACFLGMSVGLLTAGQLAELHPLLADFLRQPGDDQL
jgi:hypothetical protein